MQRIAERFASFAGFMVILGLVFIIGAGAVVLKDRYDSWLLLTGLFTFALISFTSFYRVHLHFRRRWRKKRAGEGGVFA